MKRKLDLRLSSIKNVMLIFVVTLSIGIGFSGVLKAEKTETIKIGYLAALSGPAVMWGLPGLTGCQIVIDQINGEGGLLVGGTRYKIKLVKYDDQGEPGHALMGARKLILEDRVVAILMNGGEVAVAAGPIAAKHKVPMVCLHTDGFAPQFSYWVGVSDNYPMYHGVSIQYIADNYPNAKKMAFLTQDEHNGISSRAWTMAAAEATGLEVTYDKLFSLETMDFAPIVSAALATNPDIVSLGAAFPEYRALLIEQLYLQGFKGILVSSEYELADIFAKVPVEFMDGAIAHYPMLDDPVLPKSSHDMFKAWNERYGEGGKESVGREFYSIDWQWSTLLSIWAWGAQKAGSIDGEAVLKTILAADKVPHLLGDGKWWGKEVQGANNHLMASQYITELKDGRHVIKATYEIPDWYQKNKKYVHKWMEKADLMYFQR